MVDEHTYKLKLDNDPKILHSPSPPLADIVIFDLLFKNASTKKRFPHPYKKYPVNGSDIICNNSSSPLINIVTLVYYLSSSTS